MDELYLVRVDWCCLSCVQSPGENDRVLPQMQRTGIAMVS